MDICTKTDNPMNGKAPVIEFYRYVFMVVLLAWHWHGGTKYFSNGYLVVEFFFILSGYLLMESYLKRTKTAVQYTVDKLKRTYWEYFVAFCISFLYFGVLAKYVNHIPFSMEMFFKFIYEAALIQSIGIFTGINANYPMWYFSVLIWGGALLYYLISKYTELSTHLFIPLISLIALTYLSHQGDSLESSSIEGGVFYIPFIRGIAEMGLGILLCTFAHSRYNKIRSSKCIDCLSVIALVLTFYVFDASGNYAKYVLLTFPLIIFAGMQNRSFLHALFQHKIWLKLGGITWEMYLIHAVLGNIVYNLLGFSWSIYWFILYVVIATCAAFVFKSGCQRLQYILFRQKEK